MAAPATTRKPRQPRQPKTTTPTLAAWPRLDHDAIAALLAEIRKAHEAIGSVPRYHTQADKAALDAIDRDSAGEEADGKQAAAEQAGAAHRAVNSGRDVSDRYGGGAYERSYRGEMGGCGDTPVLPFRRPQKTIPVAQEASTLGPLDEDQERHFKAAGLDAPEDAPGPVHPVAPPAGPGAPDADEDDPALDKAPVLVISSDPMRMKKTSGEDGEAS